MDVTTFEQDLLSLSELAKQIENFISIEHQFVSGGLVLGLSAKFGSGKSSFLRMWISSLNEESEDTNRPLPVLLNAWESDYLGDPLFAIISALANRFEKEGKSTEKLIEAAKDFGWFATAIGNQVAKKATGIDAIAAGDLAEKKKKARAERSVLFPDSFTVYEGRRNAMLQLKASIEELVSSTEQLIVLMVDELDRCRPDYAISYLETIKHIFDIEGLVFIIAADRRQLENSAKTAFGADLDFDEYYRKFIHRETTLPSPKEPDYKKITTSYISYYLEREGSRFCYMKLEHYHIENLAEIFGILALTPRQIQEVFRTLGHIFETTDENRGRLRWCLGVGSILMASLKVGAPETYRALGSADLPPKEASTFFSKVDEERTAEWWFVLCLTGGGLKIKEETNIEDVLKEVGLVSGEEEAYRKHALGQWHEGWGHSFQKRIPQIYSMIEELSKWG